MLFRDAIRLMSNVSYKNLLNFGNCESVDGWNTASVNVVLDNGNKFDGVNCLKITEATVAGSRIYRDATSLFTSGKYYLLSGYLKNYNCSVGISILPIFNNDNTLLTSATVSATNYMRVGVLIQPSDFDLMTSAELRIKISCNAVGQYGFCDNLMLNEITSADYSAGLSTCLAKYPYKEA